MEASEAGHTEIVRMLLDAGATLKQEKKVIHNIYSLYSPRSGIVTPTIVSCSACLGRA